MATASRKFVDELGGYRKVAGRLGVKPTTLHSHITKEKLPPRWYFALCDLAVEEERDPPTSEMFDFKPLVPKLEEVSPPNVSVGKS